MNDENQKNKNNLENQNYEEERDDEVEWDYGEILEALPNFFDSEDLKTQKKAMIANLTHSEAMSFYQALKKIDESPHHPSMLTPSEIMEKLPSVVFDSKEVYDSKMAELEGLCFQQEDYTKFPYVETSEVNNAENTVATPKKSEIVTVYKAEDYRHFINGFFYRCDELIYLEPKTQEEIVLGNFWVEIITEIVHVKLKVNEQNQAVGQEEKTRWKVRIHCLGEMFEEEVSLSDLQNYKEILRITKDRGYLESGGVISKLYRRYINLLIKNRCGDKLYFYNCTGWIKLINNRWVYITDSGVIGYENEPFRADVPYRFRYDAKRIGTLEIFQEFIGMKKICKYRLKNSVFLLHYACLATMTTIFQEIGHSINFVVALIGTTNSQKTACGVIFSRMFDRSPKSVADIRFNSTEIAIMEKMENYGDAILMVDDLLPLESRSSANEQQKKSETIIRSYGDRVARKRSQTYAKINGVSEFNAVKGCCLITGEVLNTNSESSATRVIQLRFERGDVDLNLLTFYQENLLNFPTFLYDFIFFVQTHLYLVQKIIKEELEKMRKMPMLDISTPRFRDSFGVMAAETRIFYQYAIERHFMSQENADKARNTDLVYIENIIKENDFNVKSKSPAAIICLALRSAIRRGNLRIITQDECEKSVEFKKSVVDAGEYIYILPATLWDVYSKYCKEMGQDIMYKNSRELVTPLKQVNMILIKKEGGNDRASHKVKSKSQSRFFYIKKVVYEEINGIFEVF